MRLLITRPEPDASRTAALVRDQGHEPILCPVSETRFLRFQTPAIRPDGLLVTSRNGVRALAAQETAQTGVPSWTSCPIVCVGDKTARLARDMGWSCVHSGDGSVEDLTDVLTRLYSPTTAPRWLYATCPEHTGDLAGDLSAHGYVIETAYTYTTQPRAALPESVISQIADGKIDGILLFSRRSAQIFVDLVRKADLDNALNSVSFICLSQAVSAPILLLGLEGAVIWPERPRLDALLACLPRQPDNE